jgi:DNA-binding protein HU-beta
VAAKTIKKKERDVKKAEFIDALEAASGQSKTSVKAILDALPDVVFDALKTHGTVTLPGVAKIDAKTRGPRTIRNPQTGAAMDKPAEVVAGFKVAKSLKDSMGTLPAK